MLRAVNCGAKIWAVIEEFAEAKKEWFVELLGIPNGLLLKIPLVMYLLRLILENSVRGFMVSN
ncbi:MAG: hypothetical protein L3J59_15355 [Methylococcaceae bacterium]|nr:hypothetical protein [Methylococcaceae bacterium]